MDSADAAPPPKAPPLPSEATNATKTPIRTKPVAAKTSVSPQEPSTANTNTNNTTTTTKKRPLPGVKTVETSTLLSSSSTLVVPALKSQKALPAKEAPVKAKKTIKKKKKKKFSSILSGMMKPKKEIDVKVERESLRKSLGGGNFIKVDKI
eukprot:CAMPEP_0116136270 /NCGR_PEP_ID=MMETSP0329-20121206/11632_1 /TAXON_ID=697910 /ORGANISM="Pseudo-nitzschia arenysensis, Strain B593" /LENGTH=150 /DNA_ID=CAMNT_0003631121 /DNA_START=445 /DNA_END=897 /DNA_ORIENTATION=-